MSGIAQLTSGNQFLPPPDVPGPNPWTIVEVQKPIVGLGGHNFFVLVDPNGHVVSELDGGAFDSNKNFKAVGDSTNSLGAGIADTGGLYDTSYAQLPVTSGSYSQIMGQWKAGVDAGVAINNLGLSYPDLGIGTNSNSVASTLAAAMGAKEPSDLTGSIISALNPFADSGYTPGSGTILLNPQMLQQIQQQNGLKPSTAPSGSSQLDSDTTDVAGDQTIVISNANGTTTTDVIGNGADGGVTLTSTTDSATGQTVNTIQGTLAANGTGGTFTIDNVSLTLQGTTTNSAAVNADVQAIIAGMNSASSSGSSSGTQVANNGPTWIVPGLLAVGPNGQVIATDATPAAPSGSGSQSFRVISENSSGQTQVTQDSVVTDAIGTNNITLVMPSVGSAFAVIQSTDASASSSKESYRHRHGSYGEGGSPSRSPQPTMAYVLRKQDIRDRRPGK